MFIGPSSYTCVFVCVLQNKLSATALAAYKLSTIPCCVLLAHLLIYYNERLNKSVWQNILAFSASVERVLLSFC